MIQVSTLLCDYKRGSALIGLSAMLKMSGALIHYYVNIETGDEGDAIWGKVISMLEASHQPFDYDIWRSFGSWNKRGEKDQDGSRLEPICIARNMARSCAIKNNATHLCFIDSDVVPNEPTGIQMLLRDDFPICGGVVPGRGVHSSAKYIFHPAGNVPGRDYLLRCGHGTMGYVLIQRSLFSVLPFRWGPHPARKDLMMSEDPCFAADAAYYREVPYWIIDTRVTAQHVDDPDHPLTADQADNTGGV